MNDLHEFSAATRPAADSTLKLKSSRSIPVMNRRLLGSL